MTIEANPPRELSSDRVVRLAVGRQLVRVTLLCALSLVVGIGIGQYFVRQQLQIQQGLVGQLQNEIRGLTGDIQRMELSNSQNIARFENTIHRLETAQRVERMGELQQSGQRLSTLERLTQRQIAGLEAAQAACLAEFEPYRRKHLAVPLEAIDAAIARLSAGRIAELNLLSSEIRAHSEFERVRLATLESAWVLSRGPQSRSKPSITVPVPINPHGGPMEQTADIVRSKAVSNELHPITDSSIPPAIAAPIQQAHSDLAWSPGDDLAAAAPANGSPVEDDAESLMPVPDTNVPAARPWKNHSTTGRAALISFASGRSVQAVSPQQCEAPPSRIDPPIAAAAEPLIDLRSR
ncbi:MAG: hypothetical protein KDA75_11325 [Planctomycetaceae bacterium]|nr:hypothetical protein [Planctomycetaceae bacterium]